MKWPGTNKAHLFLADILLSEMSRGTLCMTYDAVDNHVSAGPHLSYSTARWPAICYES